MVRSAGWQPICEKRFPFEMTASFTLNPLTPGVVDMELPHKIQDQHRTAFPPAKHISVEAGRLLGQWARGDAIEDAGKPDKPLLNRARLAARKGPDALRAFSEELSPEDCEQLKPIKYDLLGIANRNLPSSAVEFITEDQARDLESMLSERAISQVQFLGRIKAVGIAQIPKADHALAIRTIEQWV